MMTDLSDHALRWFLRLRSPDCTDAERREFDAWRTADREHQRAFDELQSMWNGMDVLLNRPCPEVERSLEQWERPEKGQRVLSGRRAHAASPARHVIARVSIATAASLLLVVLSVWWWTVVRVEVTVYHTAKGEQQTVTMPDGTTIDLNTDTRVSVQMSGRFRGVVLERGEAFFTVAPDAKRAFGVTAGNSRIRDIGTQFSVYRRQDQVTVAVLDGAVQIEAPPNDAPSNTHWPRVISKGERLSYTSDGRLLMAERADGQIVAWRQGKLVFNGLPLRDVIQEVNRYWPGEIILTDPALGAVEVKGVFNSRDLTEFFTALPRILPVRVQERNGRRIIVSPTHP